MICNGCGNQEALEIRARYGDKKERIEVCDRCGNVRVPDITGASCPVGGYFDENLADKEHRKGQFIKSKTHKKEVMKRLGLEEVGSQKNPVTGKVTPYIKDPEKRRRYCIENFGEERNGA